MCIILSRSVSLTMVKRWILNFSTIWAFCLLFLMKWPECPSQCSRRCSKTQYHKPCMFFCQKCCNKCLCVPPGFYGNKGVCPCYNNWKTKEGGPKCPWRQPNSIGSSTSIVIRSHSIIYIFTSSSRWLTALLRPLTSPVQCLCCMLVLFVFWGVLIIFITDVRNPRV